MLGLREYKRFFKDHKEQCLKHKLKDIYYEFKYAWQRAWRGYDDTEIFATNNTFMERYEAILSHSLKVHHGYPADMTNEEWEHVLIKMINLLKMMDEEEYEIDNYEEIMLKTDKAKNDFFIMFSEHFWNLWD